MASAEVGGAGEVRRRPSLAFRVVTRLLVTAYLFFLVAWPVSLVAQRTFEDGFTSLRSIFEDPDVRTALQLTIVIALISVVVNLVFGVGMSILLVRYRFPGRRLLSALVDLPLSVSPVVVGLALILVSTDAPAGSVPRSKAGASTSSTRRRAWCSPPCSWPCPS